MGISMKCIVMCGIVILFLPLNSDARSKVPFWELVGQGNLIIEGRLEVSLENVQEIKRSGKDEYIGLKIFVKDVLRGSWDKEVLNFTQHSGRVEYGAVSMEQLLSLHKKQVIVFFEFIGGDGRGGHYYLADDTPKSIQQYSDELVVKIQNEITVQKKLVKESIKYAISHELPFEAKVKKLVEVIVDKNTKDELAQEVYQEMMSLGEKAVPAIIKYLDDRRPLAIPYIALEVKGGFESIAHYGPEKVLDVLTLILSRITHKRLISLYNGGHDIQREAAVKIWRVYERRTYGEPVTR